MQVEAKTVILTIKIYVSWPITAALPQCASRFKAIKVSYCGSEFFCSRLALKLVSHYLPSY